MTFDEVFTGKRRWAYQCGTIFEQIKLIPDNSIHCIVTSPPYFNLRDYNVAGQLGLEPTLSEYLANQVAVFEECRRVLHPSGILFLNIGDSYNATKWKRKVGQKLGGFQASNKGSIGVDSPYESTLKPKDLLGVPWRLAIALQEAGWYLRSDIIWSKTNAMPESIHDRPSKAHEYIFMLTKSRKYFYDMDAATRKNQELQSNMRTVFTVSVASYRHSHFATFPRKLIQPLIRIGSSSKGVCPSCLNPWKRTVDKIRVATRPGNKTKIGRQSAQSDSPYNRQNGSVVGNRDPKRHCTQRIPTGWKPGCDCGIEETIPATVFDPYLGSGTTMQVAIEEGRRCIGVELNPKYCKLIDRRMEFTTTNLFAGV